MRDHTHTHTHIHTYTYNSVIEVVNSRSKKKNISYSEGEALVNELPETDIYACVF